MTTGKIARTGMESRSKRPDWIKTGVMTAFLSIAAVLSVQILALTVWPDLASFRPLDAYARTALFTLVPALGATAVFAWFVKHQDHPVRKFMIISAVVLLLSFIPDYALPLENKTLLGSSVAAFMHLTAGITTVGVILFSYKSRTDL